MSPVGYASGVRDPDRPNQYGGSIAKKKGRVKFPQWAPPFFHPPTVHLLKGLLSPMVNFDREKKGRKEKDQTLTIENGGFLLNHRFTWAHARSFFFAGLKSIIYMVMKALFFCCRLIWAYAGGKVFSLVVGEIPFSLLALNPLNFWFRECLVFFFLTF